jgi:glycosyltransferase involved in cell wall biosynthesis
VLSAADCLITTSSWSRDRLLEWYSLDGARVHAAPPGVEPAELAAGTPTGAELLCVAAVTAHKGHDVLVDALAAVADLPWRCRCVGSLDREPEYAARVRERAAAAGLADRVRFLGPRTGAQLDRCYSESDLLVLASRGETYGMVAAEALARGVPVVAFAVGGLWEALGRTSAGVPGMLVPAGDPAALAAALRRWLVDADLRRRLRAAAQERRSTVPGWAETVHRVAGALRTAAAQQR